jgi:hypothetical protein
MTHKYLSFAFGWCNFVNDGPYSGWIYFLNLEMIKYCKDRRKSIFVTSVSKYYKVRSV